MQHHCVIESVLSLHLYITYTGCSARLLMYVLFTSSFSLGVQCCFPRLCGIGISGVIFKRKL